MHSDMHSFLESVAASRSEQQRLSERIAELEARCEKITATLTGMPRGGNSDAEQQWAALADEKARLTEQLKLEIDRARRVEEFLQGIPYRLYREALMRRYVHLQTVPQITEALAKSGKRRSQRQVERIIANAEREAEKLWKNHTQQQEENQ